MYAFAIPIPKMAITICAAHAVTYKCKRDPKAKMMTPDQSLYSTRVVWSQVNRQQAFVALSAEIIALVALSAEPPEHVASWLSLRAAQDSSCPNATAVVAMMPDSSGTGPSSRMAVATTREYTGRPTSPWKLGTLNVHC
jgi:hypothetical protein